MEESKARRKLDFFFYSWTIYNSWLFFIAPWGIKDIGPQFYFMFFCVYYTGIFPGFMLLMYFYYLVLAQELTLVSAAFTALALNYWLKKQTVLGAWLLALAGMCCGPGLASRATLAFRMDDDTFYYGLLSMNAFYLSLGVANWLQKKYWPNNKFCNRIRAILAWPCRYRWGQESIPCKEAGEVSSKN